MLFLYLLIPILVVESIFLQDEHGVKEGSPTALCMSRFLLLHIGSISFSAAVMTPNP